MRAVAPRVLALVLVVAALALPAGAQPAPDLERAKDLYLSAEAAMREARYDDAARDYGAAYELTKDPAFFYKLGSANERAGKCDVAVIYYRRYLKDGKPTEAFAKLTAARIEACGGAAAQPAPGPEPGGSAEPGGSPEPGPRPEPKPEPAPTPGGAAGGDPVAGAAGSEPPPPLPPQLGRHRGPWLLVGGSLALVTVGAVFAYSANAAERDVEDLYVGLNGTPPPYNATTRKLHDDAIAEGRRYQTLSIVSFSLAGAMAAGAAVWFALDRGEQLTVAPALAPGSAGVSTTIRF